MNFVPPYPEYEGKSAAELGAEMERLDALADQQEAVLKETKARIQNLATFHLPRALEREGLRNFRLASGRGITTEDRMFVSITAANKEAAMRWFKDHGAAGLVKEDVPNQTLKAYIKDCIKEGREYPADLLSISVVSTAKFFK